MVVGGLARDDQPRGDVGVAQAVGQQGQHVELARGQPGRVGPGGRRAAPRDAADARLAQPGPEQGGDRAGVQRVEQRERGQQVVGRPGVPPRQRLLVRLVRRRRRGAGSGGAEPTCWIAGLGEAPRPAPQRAPAQRPGRRTSRVKSPVTSGRRAEGPGAGDPGLLGERGRGRRDHAGDVEPGHQPPQLVEVRVLRRRRPAGRRAARARGAATAWPSGMSPAASTARASCVGLGPAALQQPQPRPHPELPRAADRDVALLAEAQRLGDDVLGLANRPARRRGGRGCSSASVARSSSRCRRPTSAAASRSARPPTSPSRSRATATPIDAVLRSTTSPPARRRSVCAVCPTVAPPRRHRPTPRGRRAGPARSRVPADRRRTRGSRWPLVLPHGERAVGRVPGEAGECRVRGADRDDVAQLAAQLQRLRPGRDRVVEPVGEVQLRRQGLEQAGAGGRVVARRGAARARRTRRPRGAPRTGTPRPPRRRVPQDPGHVAGGRGVVGEHARRPPPTASSASIIAACSAGSAPGATAPRTAERAISWRNATPRPRRSSRPVAASAPTVAGDTPSASSSSRPTGSGVHDSSSRQRRAGGASPAVRASTASRTLSGIGESGWARIWLTKNGLPAVRRWTSAGSSPCPSTSAATADRLSGVSCSRRRVRRRRPGRRARRAAGGRAPTASR